MDGSFVSAVIVDSIILLAILIIAPRYHWFWHDVCGMEEPFTYWFSRFCVEHPWVWWSAIAILAGLSLYAAIALPWYWRISGVVATGFFGWFIPHIIVAAQRWLGFDQDNPLDPINLSHIWIKNAKKYLHII